METNKIYISQLNKTDEENIYSIGFTHYCPFDPQHGLGKTEEELMEDGLLIDKSEIPEPENREGYRHELVYDKLNNKLSYKYYEFKEEIQESNEQIKLKELENKIKEQEQAILELTSMITGGNTNA